LKLYDASGRLVKQQQVSGKNSATGPSPLFKEWIVFIKDRKRNRINYKKNSDTELEL
jgi:hypothetical protein